LKAFGMFLGSLLGVAVLLALASAYSLFNYVVNVFASLEPQTATLAAIASTFALLCAVILAEGLKARAQRSGESTETAEKSETYERLLCQCIERLKEARPEERSALDAELAKIEYCLALGNQRGQEPISSRPVVAERRDGRKRETWADT
jgi:hypothetical protein